ncbi:MAG: SUMF1/EgtB/PvdO family nonheme iron enzyme, partial [Candidatus Eremiobacterota bacterium]
SHVIKPRKTTNPTKVNGIEISEPCNLSSGDKIHMGKVVLLYQEVSEPTFNSTIDETDIPFLRSLAFKETGPKKIDYSYEEPAVKSGNSSSQSPSIQEGSFLPDYSHKYLFDDDEVTLPEKQLIEGQPDYEKATASHNEKTMFDDMSRAYDYELEIIKGDRKGEIFPLDKKDFFIGRMSKKSPSARDLLFSSQDRTISREHARFSIEDGDVYLINETKKSITLLNEIQVVDKEKLKPGDHIQIGENIVILFRKKEDLFMESEEGDSTVVPAGANVSSSPVVSDVADLSSFPIVSGWADLSSASVVSDVTDLSSAVAEPFKDRVTSMEEVSSDISVTDEPPLTAGMVFIEEGPFTAGTDQEFYIKSYYIDIYPVTNDDYRKFIETTGYRSEGRWESSFIPGKEEHPAVNVTFNDALAYAEWTGKRLPDEFEWEKAARGNDRRLYPWGNDWDRERLNSRENNLNGTMSVYNFNEGRSPYGIMDMAGNTWEWTDSSYISDLNGTPSKPSGKTLRGGSWLNKLEVPGCTLRCEAWSDEFG